MPAPKDSEKCKKWKERISQSNKGMIAWNKGKSYEETYGLEKAIELKELNRKNRLGIKTGPRSEEVKKMSENRTGMGLKHGNCSRGKTPTYISWEGMKNRCLNPNNISYKYYGEKGVMVCDRWLKFENFLEDMGNRPEGKTIDRIDPFGNYELCNCKWSTQTEQIHNRRNRKENKNDTII